MLKKNNNYRNTIVLGVILITFGITLMSNNYIKTKREETFNDMNLMLFDIIVEEKDENDVIVDTTIENDINEEQNEEIVDKDNIETDNKPVYVPYVGILNIPKINLERGFYDKDSYLNNVDYNILFHRKSDYPDKENGNVILASHSGTSSISYFKNLYLLEVNDEAYITYVGKTYTYKIVNIYQEEKDGNVTIYRDDNKTTLTLITCTKNDDTKQTVYILERI